MTLKQTITLLFIFIFNNAFSQQRSVPLDSMDIEESVMVNIEENFGPGINTVAQALNLIERKYTPFDNVGRTFAILEVKGEKMKDGKMRLSIFLSSEKVGRGQLILKTNKKILWNCKFLPKDDGKKATGTKALTIYVEQTGVDKGKYLTADGSTNPADIFVCKIKENGKIIGDYWKDGSVLEFIFIYSACGCPVHVKFVRYGNRCILQNTSNVFFPDDPEVITILRNLMKY